MAWPFASWFPAPVSPFGCSYLGLGKWFLVLTLFLCVEILVPSVFYHSLCIGCTSLFNSPSVFHFIGDSTFECMRSVNCSDHFPYTL